MPVGYRVIPGSRGVRWHGALAATSILPAQPGWASRDGHDVGDGRRREGAHLPARFWLSPGTKSAPKVAGALSINCARATAHSAAPWVGPAPRLCCRCRLPSPHGRAAPEGRPGPDGARRRSALLPARPRSCGTSWTACKELAVGHTMSPRHGGQGTVPGTHPSLPTYLPGQGPPITITLMGSCLGSPGPASRFSPSSSCTP